ncbi:SulA-like leucine-rich domain-containing protein, partial [Oleiphilus sp. HI0067]
MNEAYIQQDLGFNDKALNTSFIEIDAPNSAKKEANVTEIIIAKSKADSVQMLLPMLTKLNQEQRWLALIDPPSELLHRWKSERKTDLNEIIVLRSNKQISGDALCQKALAMGTCHAAILWTKGINNEFFEQLERASI